MDHLYGHPQAFNNNAKTSKNSILPISRYSTRYEMTFCERYFSAWPLAKNGDAYSNAHIHDAIGLITTIEIGNETKNIGTSRCTSLVVGLVVGK